MDNHKGFAPTNIQLEAGWLGHLQAEFEKDYMKQLKTFLAAEKATRKVIYPGSGEWFNALNTTPLDRVKVVILGQDPYHGPGQAHGLCFSVRPGIALPPSLQNIYKEIQADFGLQQSPFKDGCLIHWAEQGVLLLNSVLTVERSQAASHQGKGWETFTDEVIHLVAREKQHCVFMLWGSYAQKKGAFIDREKHLILKAPHPSPLSAHRGFLGCKHFSQCNDYLQANGLTPIQWYQ